MNPSVFVRFRRDLFSYVFVVSFCRFQLHAEHVLGFFDSSRAFVDFVFVVWDLPRGFVRVSVFWVSVDGRILFVGFRVDVRLGDSVAVGARVVIFRVIRDE